MTYFIPMDYVDYAEPSNSKTPQASTISQSFDAENIEQVLDVDFFFE